MKQQSFLKQGGWLTALLILLCVLATNAPGATPRGVVIQGKLTGVGGRALSGTRVWQVQFWNASSGGQTEGGPLMGSVVVGTSGRFSLEVTPPAEVWTTRNVYYELAIDSAPTPDGSIDAVDVFPGRVKVDSVFYAQALARQGAGSGVDADLLDGLHANAFVTTASLASSGMAAVAWGNLTGMPLPLAAVQNATILGDITGVTAGAGLNGGGTTGDVTMSINFGGTGSASTVARSDHSHQFSEIGGTVSDDQVPDSITINQAKTALLATSATLAIHALLADQATTAATALHAFQADLASTATTATTAIHALLADQATTATSALALAHQGTGSGVDADLLDGLHANAFVTTASLASSGMAPVAWGNLTGMPLPLAAVQDSTILGDITGVTAGAGLSGGGTTGNVSLGVVFAGTGSASSVARSDHSHQFSEIGGTISDAQVPDSITINQAKTALLATTATTALHSLLADQATTAATALHAFQADLASTATTATTAIHALLADQATTATSALALAHQGTGSGVDADLLDGQHANTFVTTSSLASAGMAAVAWGNLTGMPAPLTAVQDSTILGDITGVTAGAGLSGGGTTGNISLGVVFGGTGSASSVARSDHSHQFSEIGGTISDAQVPDSITIDQAKTALLATTATTALHAFQADQATTATFALAAAETDTLASVTARGAATNAEVTLAGGVKTGTISESQAGAGVQVENLTLRSGTLQVPAVAPPATMANQLVNTSASLYWDGAPLMTRTGEAFVIVKTTSNATSNGLNLIAAYQQAKALTPHGLPLAADNRAVVLVSPGRYDLGSSALTLDQEFVDVVGLSSVPQDQDIVGVSAGFGTGVVRQTANNVHLENLRVECQRVGAAINLDSNDPAAYYPDSNTAQTVVRNCEFKDSDSSFCTRLGVTYAGTYEKVTGTGFADHVLGGYAGSVASGTFTDCSGADGSFAGDGGTASGTFVNCTGGNHAFGGNNSNVASRTSAARLEGCHMTGALWSGAFAGKMRDCQWSAGLTLAASARVYRSTFLGTVNLNNTAAGLTQCCAQNITNFASNCFGATNAAALNIASASVQ